MAKFAIYQYLFAKITSPIEGDLFYDYSQVNVEESWKNKQEIFQHLFDKNTDIKFIGNKSEEPYQAEIIHYPSQPEIIILRIAPDDRIMGLEENLHKKRVNHNPSALVIIDNRDGIQRMAIEERKGSFTLKQLYNILTYTFSYYLHRKLLHFDLVPKKQSKQVWKVIDKYKNDMSEMTLSFLHPNLPDITSMMDVMSGVFDTAEEFNCNPTLNLKAIPGQTLKVDASSLRLKCMVAVCAATGQPITIKTKDGNSIDCLVETTDLDVIMKKLNAKRADLNNIAQAAPNSIVFNQIKLFVNSLKLIY